MRVIPMVNQKGGAGKTAPLCGFLSAATAKCERVAVIDTDQIGNVVQWAQRSVQVSTLDESVIVTETFEPDEVREFAEELEENDEADLLLIDTAGHAGPMHDAVVLIFNLILCPIQPSPSDLQTALGSANWMYRRRDRFGNPADLPPFRAVVNAVGNKPTQAEAAVLKAMQTQKLVGDGPNGPTEKLLLIPGAIKRRDAYRRIVLKARYLV